MYLSKYRDKRNTESNILRHRYTSKCQLTLHFFEKQKEQEACTCNSTIAEIRICCWWMCIVQVTSSALKQLFNSIFLLSFSIPSRCSLIKSKDRVHSMCVCVKTWKIALLCHFHIQPSLFPRNIPFPSNTSHRSVSLHFCTSCLSIFLHQQHCIQLRKQSLNAIVFISIFFFLAQ